MEKEHRVAAWRRANPEKAKQHLRDHRARRRAYIDKVRAVPCADCGGEFPAVCMDFHHRDPAEKEFTIAWGLTLAMARLEAEIAKCDIVCACCHRLRHR